jgi:DNA-binding CsgD family transcriptional regulator
MRTRALLTRGQRQVLDLAVSGLSMAEIGDALGIGPSSVRESLDRARLRMGARNNLELTARALALGLVKPPLRRAARPQRGR